MLACMLPARLLACLLSFVVVVVVVNVVDVDANATATDDAVVVANAYMNADADDA